MLGVQCQLGTILRSQCLLNAGKYNLKLGIRGGVIMNKANLIGSGGINSFLIGKRFNSSLNDKEKMSTSTEDYISKLTKEEIKILYNRKRAQERNFKDRTMAYYFTSVAVIFLGLAYAAVPLYRAICARTGFGGIPITDRRKFTDDKMIPVDTEKRIRISFTSEVSKVLPWKFQPQQREVYVLPGETALAFYKAKNLSDKDIIGMATYSITPGGAAPYFNKIQCFCFEEQKLAKGEEVDMPVFFFIDPDFATDPQMRNIDDIVLHYSFFKAHYADGEAVSDGDKPMSADQLATASLLRPSSNLVIDSVVEK